MVIRIVAIQRLSSLTLQRPTVAHGSMHAKGQCTLNTRTPHSLTPPTIANMELIEAALVAIESLGPGESINYTAIAKKYGIERSTLSWRH